MEFKEEKIDLEKYKKEYNNWLKKYMRNLLILTLFFGGILIINYLTIANRVIYILLGFPYFFYIVYTTTLASYQYAYLFYQKRLRKKSKDKKNI